MSDKMLKGYVSRWKAREKPEEHITDYWFDSDPQKAICWDTREEAESDCVIFDNRIVIPTAEAGIHICSGFKAEERAPNEFVVFLYGPFIVGTNGQSERECIR